MNQPVDHRPGLGPSLVAGLGRIEGIMLFPHQADGVAFLLSKRRAILGDDMGLGKTRQAIVALSVAVPDGPLLVVCPASLKLNGPRETHRVAPDAAVEVIGVARSPPATP